MGRILAVVGFASVWADIVSVCLVVVCCTDASRLHLCSGFILSIPVQTSYYRWPIRQLAKFVTFAEAYTLVREPH